MTVEARIANDNTALVISIKGRFDFTLLNEFRKAYSTETGDPIKVVIDMSNTTTIDSSALGMLLNMQRYLEKSDGEIRIINCNQDVKKILNITHFEKKFGIE